MAHSQETAEAVDVPATHTVDSAAAELSQMFQNEAPEEEEEQDLPEEELSEEDEDFEGEEIDEDEEPDEPAIQAPVSLTADEKEAFSQLPPEAQDYVSRLEQRRSQDVTKITTQAAEAQRAADAKAAKANQEAQAIVAEQLKAFTAQYEPQMPHTSQYRDLPSYERAMQQYHVAKQQHDSIVQQVSAIGTETPEQRQQRLQERDRELMQIPEIANPETRDKFLQDAFSVAAELGYDQAEIAEGMSLGDMKALGQAAKWKADSEELKRIRARAKKRPRGQDGKFRRSLKPGAAQPKGSGNRAVTQAKERLAQTGSVDDAQAAFKAILTQGK